MEVTVFDKETGKILFSGIDYSGIVACSDSEGTIPYLVSEDHYIRNSDVGYVPVPKPPKPSDFHIFDFETKSWVLDVSLLTSNVIRVRASLLQQSDWTQLPDVPLATKEAWAAYRQALRDLTDQPGFPLNVVWPTPPV